MANVCDYNSLTHYEPGLFNRPYRTKLTGNLQITEKDTITDPEILNSFKDQYYETYLTLKDLVFYRVFGRFQRRNGNKVFGSVLTGAFVTTEFAESIFDVKMRVALDQLWGNCKKYRPIPKVFRRTESFLLRICINLGHALCAVVQIL